MYLSNYFDGKLDGAGFVFVPVSSVTLDSMTIIKRDTNMKQQIQLRIGTARIKVRTNAFFCDNSLTCDLSHCDFYKPRIA